MINSNNSIATKLTTGDGLNYLNVGLMLISLVVAYVIPFELFLFVYAVLGPLHYLTEISWLDKKNYFVKSKNDIWVLILLVVFISIGLYNPKLKVSSLVGSFMFSGFIYALALLFIENFALKLFIVFLTFVFSFLLKVNTVPTPLFIIFAVLLPTIVHVYLFTGMFILFGALKSKSKSGIFSLLVFVVCTITFFIYTPTDISLPVSNYAKEAYAFFRSLNIVMHDWLGYGQLQFSETTFFSAEKSLTIMRFIAFAYTYHYLNWFSKTTVIKWNDVSKKRMAIILLLWIASVGLYAFSYSIGFYVLFLLSMLHVFLEFPLNHFTFIGIGKELKLFVGK